jgi:hypothetical protein
VSAKAAAGGYSPRVTALAAFLDAKLGAQGSNMLPNVRSYKIAGKTFAYVLKADLAAEANARKARDFADDTEKNLQGQMGRIPVIDCTPPKPQEPPPGGMTPPPDTGGAHVGEPTPLTPLPEVPDCFKSMEEQDEFIKRVLLIIDDLRDALINASPEMRETARLRLDDAYLTLGRAKNKLVCDPPKQDGPDISIGIGIGIGGGADDHHHDDDHDHHRPDPDDHHGRRHHD